MSGWLFISHRESKSNNKIVFRIKRRNKELVVDRTFDPSRHTKKHAKELLKMLKKEFDRLTDCVILSRRSPDSFVRHRNFSYIVWPSLQCSFFFAQSFRWKYKRTPVKDKKLQRLYMDTITRK